MPSSSSPSPFEHFNQLSLESMPPRSRAQSRSQPDDGSSPPPESESSDSSSDETTDTIVFPSKLSYSLSNLNQSIRDRVVYAMEDTRPQLVLQLCQARDQDVIFQVSELVEYNIRVGTQEGQFDTVRCNCQNQPPCQHILWLFDEIAKEVLVDQGRPLTLNDRGYSNELGNPFDAIREFHLDLLSASLHSRALSLPVSSEDDTPDPRRVQEIREMLASLQAVPIDEYRPDLFDAPPPRGNQVIERQDLECTIFRMLLGNHEFFRYFLSCMWADELVHNPFRRLQQRADAALAGLDAYGRDPSQQAAGRPKDVVWCANHLRRVEQQINAVIEQTERPLTEWEFRSAAGALIHILEAVVSLNRDLPPSNRPKAERNLYFNLIGDRDHEFVVGVLNNMPPSSITPLVGIVQDISNTIAGHGVPETYAVKLSRLVERCRGSSAGRSSASGSKRQGVGQDRKAKRMK
jgi:hypothetical protein